MHRCDILKIANISYQKYFDRRQMTACRITIIMDVVFVHLIFALACYLKNFFNNENFAIDGTMS